MANNTTDGFLTAEGVMEAIEGIIASTWNEENNDSYEAVEDRVEHFFELMDLVIELKWRYGEKHVHFKFGKKSLEGSISIDEIIPTEFWKDKVFVVEDVNTSKVFIIQ